MTSLEALNYLEDIAYGRKMEYDPHDLKLIVEKSLKALEIIKKKKVDMSSLIRPSKGETQYKEIAGWYNLFREKNERLTSKEVGLLLEILELKKDT